MYVYFVKSPTEPPSVKVGRTTSMKQRLQALQTACAHRLEVIGRLRCFTAAQAGEFERAVHVALKPYRMSGEWFTLCPEVESYIQTVLQTKVQRPAMVRKPRVVRKPRGNDLLAEWLADGRMLKIPDAAAKYGVDVKRLRGAVYTETQAQCFRADLPIGDAKLDVVQDDALLGRWVERVTSLSIRLGER